MELKVSPKQSGSPEGGCKMVGAYQELVDKIPAELLWVICGQDMISAVMGLDAIIQALVGPEKRNR